MRRALAASCALAALAALAAGPAPAQSVFIAAGDSLTRGFGDPEERGYPRRLEVLLRRELGDEVRVVNEGMDSETSSGLLSRIDALLAAGGDVMLVMTGTNDVSLMAEGELAPEATAFNLEELGRRINKAGLEPVHATVIPRPPYALSDKQNFFTRRVAWDLRELAAQRKRRLVDAYQAFDPLQLFDPTAAYYAPALDPETGKRDFVGHLNAEGYDRLAAAFADVLLGVDSVPPVVGDFTPGLVGAVGLEVPVDQVFRVPLYEPAGAAGFDTDSLRLLINGTAVGEIEGRPKSGRVELVHEGLDGLGCLAELEVEAQDLAEPPNRVRLPLAIYTIEDRSILAGDVDFNCFVEPSDIEEFAESFGRVLGEPGFSHLVDFVADDRIDGLDFAVLARNFGETSLDDGAVASLP